MKRKCRTVTWPRNKIRTKSGVGSSKRSTKANEIRAAAIKKLDAITQPCELQFDSYFKIFEKLLVRDFITDFITESHKSLFTRQFRTALALSNKCDTITNCFLCSF